MARQRWIEGRYRVVGDRRGRRWAQTARQFVAVAFAIAGGWFLTWLLTPPVHVFVEWLFSLWDTAGR